MEELKWRQLKHNQLMSSQGPHFSSRNTAKTNGKSTNLRENGISWYKCCCERFNIIHGENPSEEVDDDDDENDISIMNKSQLATIFSRAPEIYFRYETEAKKVMVDFKFDALYRYVFLESLIKSG